MFKFRLYFENGEDIGEFATSVPNWKPEDEFFNGDHHRFRVVNFVEPFEFESEEFAGILVVTPLELAEP